MTPASVVVLGGGIAALSFVDALRTGGNTDPVVVVDPSDFPYDRPPLSKGYLAGSRSAGDIVLADVDWFTARDVSLLGGRSAVAIHPGNDEVSVELDDGTVLAAATLVLAVGAYPIVPGIPGLVGDRVHILRDLSDADRLRSALVPGARLLIIGAGLIGAEVASTAAELGVEVTVVDLVDVPLEGAVGMEAAEWLHGLHSAHGVQTLQAGLERIEAAADGRVSATLRGVAEPQVHDAVLVCVGAAPRVDLASAAGIEVDAGVLVDDRQRTSHPRILAIGDCSRRRGRRRAEHWEGAKLSGERAAAVVCGGEPAAETAAWFWTDRYDLHVEAVGDAASNDGVRRVRRGGDRAWSVVSIRDGRVVGGVSVDDAATMRVVRRLVDRGTPVDPDLLEDPGTDLRKLLRT